ncbi:MAG: FAD-binding oxidoreductase [Nitrospinaceae bacterium]|jgi:D-lactate dehydrogenase (cytochrome)|nr:MAG: FAD-binding oxidoreductase [Nitrospinaceae bacterium]
MIVKRAAGEIAPYLRDASNFPGGFAEEVVIPETLAELIGFLKTNTLPVTIAGAGTGLTASRIPESGRIVSLEKFDTLGDLEDGAIEAGPAVTLRALEDRLQATPYFYPPNPTEWLASIGGTLATNASGSRSFKMGVTRDHVLGAEIVLADGRRATLERGQTIDRPLELDAGGRIEFPAVQYRSPLCKNAAGYYIQPGMDWLDLFIGSDGTLGIFTRVRLRLSPRPAEFLSGVLFFDREEACWDLVIRLRQLDRPGIAPCSLEYFDRGSLKRLRREYENIPDRAQAALFFEQDVGRKEDLEPSLEAWVETLEAFDVLLDDSWFAENARDVARFHAFRHAIPVMINEENSRLGRVKIGTDFAVADRHLAEMMALYRQELGDSGIDHVVFGHLGDNHLHINLLPAPGEVECARAVYSSLADRVLEWGGTVSAEHGIGKLKKQYLARMAGPRGIRDMQAIKQVLDPACLLGRGNLF